MKEGWIPKNIGDVCLVIAGQSPESKHYNKQGEGLPFYQGKKDFGKKFIENPKTWTRRTTKEAEVGDILMSVRAPVGPINFSTQKICIGRGLAAIRTLDKLDRDFLFYGLLSKQPEIRGHEGAVFASINKNQIESIEFPLPPLPEQERIVAILDEAFEGIDRAVANAEKNLANARGLFESYLNKVFTEKGEGWKDRTVGEIAEHSLGKMLDKKKNKGEMKPYLRNLNVRWFEFDLDDILEMRFEGHEHGKYTAWKGDLLICEGGYPGRAAIWGGEDPIFFQKAIHRVRFPEPIYNHWLLYFLYYCDAINILKSYFTGAGIQHFTGKALHKFRIPIPPLVEMRKHIKSFEELLRDSKNLQSNYQKKLSSLAELKQSLLQKAFSGELTADDTAIKEEAVA